jgi:hypothetical protein
MRLISLWRMPDAAARDLDLSLLSLATRVGTLIVAGQKQDDAMAMGMTEHAQKHRLSSGRTG